MLDDLVSFSAPKNFSYQDLFEFKFGGVYIIFSVDKDGEREIVKIGESNFLYRRIANYLTPLQEEDKENPKKITKYTIQSEMKKGEGKGLNYQICWKIENDVVARKQFEKELIYKFISVYGRKPLMNKNSR